MSAPTTNSPSLRAVSSLPDVKIGQATNRRSGGGLNSNRSAATATDASATTSATTNNTRIDIPPTASTSAAASTTSTATATTTGGAGGGSGTGMGSRSASRGRMAANKAKRSTLPTKRGPASSSTARLSASGILPGPSAAASPAAGAAPATAPAGSADDTAGMKRSFSTLWNAKQELRYLAMSLPIHAVSGVGHRVRSVSRSASRVSLNSLTGNSRRGSFSGNSRDAAGSGSDTGVQQPTVVAIGTSAVDIDIGVDEDADVQPIDPKTTTPRSAAIQRPSLTDAQRRSQLVVGDLTKNPVIAAKEKELAGAGSDDAAGALLGASVLKDLPFTAPLVWAMLNAMLGAFQFGYNSGVINVPQSVICADLELSTLQWAMAVAIFCVGGLSGSYVGGSAADKIGRKKFQLVNNILFLAGASLEALSSGFWMIAAGRLLIGLGCGGVSVVVPLYLGEIAPPNLRGSLGTMYQFATVTGILIANLLGKPFGGPSPAWRFLLGLALLPSIIQLVAAPWMTESPRWLVLQGQEAEAKEVLEYLRGADHTADAQIHLQLFILAKEADASADDGAAGGGAEDESLDPLAPPGMVASAAASKSSSSAPTGELMRILSDPALRFLLFMGLGLQLAQQFSGVNAVFYYSTSFFASAHFSDPWLGSVLAAFVNVIATGIAVHIMDKVGRRTLILISAGGMALSCILLTVTLNLSDAVEAARAAAVAADPSVVQPEMSMLLPYTSVGAVLLFVVFFEFGLGPIPWLIISEIFGPKESATAMTLAAGLNWVSNFCVGLFFPSVQKALGTWSFVPFCCVLILVFVLTAVYVPETRGKTLQQIHALLGFRATHDRDLSHTVAMSAYDDADPNDTGYAANGTGAANDDAWDDDDNGDAGVDDD